MNPASPWFLADDLSGALGIGASFREAGREVDVVFGAADTPRPGTVLGVSSETRNRSRDRAAAEVAKLVARHGAAGLLLKKIDSTLRGPVGAELAAVVRACAGRPLLFTSAAPAAGRTVVDGRLLVDGAPVDETAFARDPEAPVRDCRVSAIIEQTGGPAVAGIALGVVRAGRDSVRNALECAWERHEVVSVDAETENDLETIAAAARTLRTDALPVGSGGIAAAWIRAEAGEARRAPATTGLEPGDTLFVVGSVHPQSRRQMALLESATGAHRCVLGESKPDAATARLAAALARNRIAMLASPLPAADGRGEARSAAQVADDLGEVVAQVVARHPVRTLVVTGGDVARAVFSALGATRVEIGGEIGFGIAVGRLVLPGGIAMQVVVKPGGFGDEGAFVRLAPR